MPRFIRDQSLSLVLLGIFLATLGGQYVTGWRSYNQDQQDHQQPPVSLGGTSARGTLSKRSLRTGRVSFCRMQPLWLSPRS